MLCNIKNTFQATFYIESLSFVGWLEPLQVLLTMDELKAWLIAEKIGTLILK